MGDSKISTVIVIVMVMFLGSQSEAQLSSNFYGSGCPKAVDTIRAAVSKAVMKEHRMGASLLRLHFHDCFVNGCDGSILLDDTSSFTGEKTAGPNDESVRGFEVIDAIKSELESLCPSTVSCSDILAVAARDSVVTLGGPSWIVEVGRRDSSSANFDSANNDLPSPALDLPGLISAFSNKGFTDKDMVALSGSHTMGQARCLIYRDRIHNESNINSAFATSLKTSCPSVGGDATSLKTSCPSVGGDANLTSLDVTTPVFFDNAYFKNLVNNKGLLHSDQQLYNGGSTDALVTAYANNKLSFFADFAAAMVKLGRLEPLTGTAGQIRTNCRKIN